MKDIIYREDAIDSPVKMVSEGLEWIPVYHIKELPSAEPRKKGKWINVKYGIGADDAECSNCHRRTPMIPSRNADGVSVDYSFHNFCPHCGARMETKMPHVVTQGW